MPETVSRIRVPLANRPIVGSIRPPGSKSLTNRGLLCAAIAKGDSTLRGWLESEDTEVMRDSLARLGVSVEELDSHTLRVRGCGGEFPNRQADLFVANSGTTIRFLTAALAASGGVYRLDGVPRMRKRPIADLGAALEQVGVKVTYEAEHGFPPLSLHSKEIPGGVVTVRGDVSSQFLSGLLLAAPYAKSKLTVEVEGDLVSQPYVQMTLEVMRSFGVETVQEARGVFHFPGGQQYRACDLEIEPDASAARYFWGAAAITGGRVEVLGLNQNSLQGDIHFCDCLEKMGCRVEYGPHSITVTGGHLCGGDFDLSTISDTAQTLAVVALFADSPTTIRGIAHNRHKETDRISDLACELRRMGAHVDEYSDGLTIHPGELKPASIETYNDHRMAMSFAIAGLRVDGMEIMNPACTAKTYPKFFDDLSSLIG